MRSGFQKWKLALQTFCFAILQMFLEHVDSFSLVFSKLLYETLTYIALSSLKLRQYCCSLGLLTLSGSKAAVREHLGSWPSGQAVPPSLHQLPLESLSSVSLPLNCFTVHPIDSDGEPVMNGFNKARCSSPNKWATWGFIKSICIWLGQKRGPEGETFNDECFSFCFLPKVSRHSCTVWWLLGI